MFKFPATAITFISTGHPGRGPDRGGPRGAGEDADVPAEARDGHGQHRPAHTAGN